VIAFRHVERFARVKLSVFLGAGVSVPSGLPTAAELTDRLFRPSAIESDEARKIRGLLTLIREYDTTDIRRVGLYPAGDGFRASGAIYRGDASTYEDLFFLCQQINLWSIGLSDNSQTSPFMEGIERRAGDLLGGTSFEARMSELSRLGRPACAYIEAVAAETLRRDYGAGLDLLLEFARDPAVDELNIATLNHDTLVEQLLTANGVRYADGFGEGDGDVRWSDDRVYDDPGARVRLFKLHGSLDWYSFKYRGGWKTALLVGPDPSCARDGAGEALSAARNSPSFLSGLNKSVSYHRGVYADVHFRFLELLRRCDLIVMSGYGWGDTALNFQLETWLDSARGNRLVLLHQSPRELVDRSVIMAMSYEGWLGSGRLAVFEHWLADTSLSDLKKLAVWPLA
jgi:hypothetical protein